MVLPKTLPDPDRHSDGLWPCAKCEPSVPRSTRLRMHCGLLPREEWPPGRGKLPLFIGPDPYTHDTCPGWVARQPAVTEAAQAYAALEAGILDRFDPLQRRAVTQAAMLGRRAFGLYEAEKIRRLGRR